MNKLTTGSYFAIWFFFFGNLLCADYKETIRFNELNAELALRGIAMPDGSGGALHKWKQR